MKKLLPFLFLIVFLSNCSSEDEDCTKVITVPFSYSVGTQRYTYDQQMEVPCDFPDAQPIQEIEPPLLENFTYEVLQWNYTEDEENNTAHFQFEIVLNNNNNVAVKGFPMLTVNIDGLTQKTSYDQYVTEPCNQLDANSSCTYALELESSLDLGRIETLELVDVEYYLTN